MATGANPGDFRAPGEEPVALNGMPVEAEVAQGKPMFQAIEVVEMSKRQQNLAKQIVLKMEGRGPYGIVDGSVSGQGTLRKVLPKLWELPMSCEGEYDGVCVLAENVSSLEKVPANADRILLYHLCNKGEITGGAFRHTSL